jgi:iron complex outermembrane receptor protein
VALGLSYDDGTFFANFNVKTVGSQYATFINDEKIPGYTVENMGFGARLPWTALRARPEIKVNLSDLSGVSYLGSVANPTPNAQTQMGVGGTTIAGSSPTYYLSGGFAAMVTYTQAF